jgi:hypothetical protein
MTSCRLIDGYQSFEEKHEVSIFRAEPGINQNSIIIFTAVRT